MTKVEFIESYIKVGNDYQWHDNHGELIRCKDCKYSDTFSDMTAKPQSQLKCLGIRYGGVEPMWYCEHGERKERKEE